MNKTVTTGKGAKWRTIRKGSNRVLVSPTGEIWKGTAADVRKAALRPWNRDRLAEHLKAARVIWRGCDSYSEEIKEARRAAIMFDHAFAEDNTDVAVTNHLRIAARAAARCMGQSEDQFVHDAIVAAIERVQCMRETKTGNAELPMTRHEAAALSRIAGIR